MRDRYLPLLFAVIICCFGCTSNQSVESESATQTEEAETPAPPATTPASSALASGSSETVVLEDGIASPRKEMRGKIGDALITINYGSPSVKGREVWGGLVPYGKVWRTGANQATSFTVSQDVEIGGGKLPAGTYGLFTIPESGKCTVIFNENSEQWGSGSYEDGKDVLRVEVATKELPEASETMEFKVEGEEILLMWDKLAVPFKVGG